MKITMYCVLCPVIIRTSPSKLYSPGINLYAASDVLEETVHLCLSDHGRLVKVKVHLNLKVNFSLKSSLIIDHLRYIHTSLLCILSHLKTTSNLKSIHMRG